MAKILVIEDDQGLLEMLATMLELDGHVVMQATNGKKGTDLVEKFSFDLVITDMVMPEKEGLETIRELRWKRPGTKIIAISGGGKGKASDYLAMAAKLGAHRTIAKPFSKTEIQSAVAGLLAEK